MKLSVIIPTFNRHERFSQTLRFLRKQSLPSSDYELIVVDDGSTPPVTLPPTESEGGPVCTLLRFEEILERCVARNCGAEIARGNILVFLDDDLEVGPGFLAAHLQAQVEWPGALAAGPTPLPQQEMAHPFVRFRQKLELAEAPIVRGPMANPSAPAGNFSMQREHYLRLGGFDTDMVGIEDQDFSHRHVAAGGIVVFLPEAAAIHWDHALTIRPYCRRTEFAAECMVSLVRRYPDWPVNRHREAVNGRARWGGEPVTLTLTKLIKSLLGFPPALSAMFGTTWLLERTVPQSRLLERVYRLLMGIHLQRGFRKGLKRVSPRVVAPQAAEQPVSIA